MKPQKKSIYEIYFIISFIITIISWIITVIAINYANRWNFLAIIIIGGFVSSILTINSLVASVLLSKKLSKIYAKISILLHVIFISAVLIFLIKSKVIRM